MRYAFFGTPKFAAIILEKLAAAGMPPALLVCNPDQPVGRKKIITPPPTKVTAEKSGIRFIQPLHFDPSLIVGMDFDLFAVAAYAKIIPKKILEIPKMGAIGVHPSLLPKYRGPTPIQTAILNGEKTAGVTLFLMDEQIDHGPVLAQRAIEGIETMNYEELHDKLAEIGGELLVETLQKYPKGEFTLRPQNESEATYTKKFADEDGFVDIDKDNPLLLERKIRALNPETGVWTFQRINDRTKRMKILDAKLEDGKLKLKKIQWEGKKPQILHS